MKDIPLDTNPIPSDSRIHQLIRFADAYWRNEAIRLEPAWRQDRLFLRSALAVLTGPRKEKQ